MTPFLATILTISGILTLFVLGREPKTRLSWALCVPILWLLIGGSRHVSEWLGAGPAMSQQQYLEGSPIDASIYALLIAAAIAVLMGRQRALAKILRRNWPIILFISYCVLSIVWSEFPVVTLKRWIKSLGDYAIVLILLTEYDPAFAARRVFAIVPSVLLPLSILFIKYYPALGRSYSAHWDSTQFFIGLSGTKNMLGMVCMIFGFSAVCRMLHVWRGPHRGRTRALIVSGSIVAMAIWLLILSDSKTSLCCFVLTSGLIAAHVFLKVARRRAILHVLVAIVVLSCFSVLFLGIGGGALHAIGRNPTLTGRTDIWAVLLSVPVNSVFGTGFESFWLGERLAYVWSFPIVNGITEAHNGYLEFYLNLGFVGVTFLLTLLCTGYRNILRLIEREPEAGRLRLGFFVIAVVYNFTEAGYRSTDLVWIAFIFAIISLPETRPVRVRRMARTYSSVVAESMAIETVV